MIRRAICTPVFIAAMATVAKQWEEPRCPSTDEWIRKMWSIYTMEYYASIRMDKYPAFLATWMGLEEIMLSEIRQQTESVIIWFHLLVEHGGHGELGEGSWGKLEGEVNYERLWPLKNNLRGFKSWDWEVGETRWWVLERAWIAWSTGCGTKTMNSVGGIVVSIAAFQRQ